MIIQKHVKRMPICFARDRVCVISIVRHFYCGLGVCWIDCSCVSYVRLIDQCGLYVDKIRIFKKNSGCGLYTGALNRPKITVITFSTWEYWQGHNWPSAVLQHVWSVSKLTGVKPDYMNLASDIQWTHLGNTVQEMCTACSSTNPTYVLSLWPRSELHGMVVCPKWYKVFHQFQFQFQLKMAL